VVADFMALRGGALPALQPLFQVVRRDEERGADAELFKQRQPRVDLAGAGVVEGQADRGALAFRPWRFCVLRGCAGAQPQRQRGGA